MSWRIIMGWVVLSALFLSSVFCLPLATFAADETQSRSQHTHWIPLRDAQGRTIDPTSPDAPPYSPAKTCGTCHHNYQTIAHGHHFNAFSKDADPGEPGEPWIWVDRQSGTQIPLSYRNWPGTYNPDKLGISRREFILRFGRHHPGGIPADATKAEEADNTATTHPKPPHHLLEIDCMICHGNDHAYSAPIRWEQIEEENFAWAPTAALGLGHVTGSTKRGQTPKLTYTPLRIDGNKHVFFDIIRQPPKNTCYRCHSHQQVAEFTAPKANAKETATQKTTASQSVHPASLQWNHDEDIHLKAGMVCADCHRNGLDHHTVRGYDGEKNPSGVDVSTLSCRGCHLAKNGGRLGAPKPLHKGLPPLHFEKLTCTACHSGPKPTGEAQPIQTAMAHGLGMPAHYTPEDPPGIVAPVFLRDETGKLSPHRMMWPAFWGKMKGDAITPIVITEDKVRPMKKFFRALGTRKSRDTFTAKFVEAKLSSNEKKAILGEERYKVSHHQWTEEEKEKIAAAQKAKGLKVWQENLPKALEELKKFITDEGAIPVYVSGGKAYRLAKEGKVETFENVAAKPYAWKLGHDVRPARQALGVKGCYDCHTIGSPIFYGKVTAIGPAPTDEPTTYTMHKLAGYDKLKVDAWSLSFLGRTMFKYFAFFAMGVVAFVVLAFSIRGANTLYDRLGNEKQTPTDDDADDHGDE